MNQVFICDAIRTPFGRYGGALSAVRTDDLAAMPIKALMARNPSVDWQAVTDVLLGCVNQAGEDNRNVARMASLLAGLPHQVPGATINRLCGSGLDAVGTAARAIRAGEASMMLAGGVESMSRAPYLAPMARWGARMGDAKLIDMMLGALHDPFHAIHMGVTAENVAKEYDISRQQQDEAALESHRQIGRAHV